MRPSRAPTLSTPTSGPAWARRRKAKAGPRGCARTPSRRGSLRRASPTRRSWTPPRPLRATAASRPSAVTAGLFAAAKPDALFMHCLPAHPGHEVEQAVLDNPRSVVFDEAENRLHVQKAILAVLSEARGG